MELLNIAKLKRNESFVKFHKTDWIFALFLEKIILWYYMKKQNPPILNKWVYVHAYELCNDNSMSMCRIKSLPDWGVTQPDSATADRWLRTSNTADWQVGGGPRHKHHSHGTRHLSPPVIFQFSCLTPCQVKVHVGACPAGSGRVQTWAHLVLVSTPSAPTLNVAKRDSMTEMRETNRCRCTWSAWQANPLEKLWSKKHANKKV